MERMRMTAGQYVAGAMHGICTQQEMAKKLGITQPAFSLKIKRSKFDLADFQIIAKELDFTDDEIVSLVRRGRFY